MASAEAWVAKAAVAEMDGTVEALVAVVTDAAQAGVATAEAMMVEAAAMERSEGAAEAAGAEEAAAMAAMAARAVMALTVMLLVAPGAEAAMEEAQVMVAMEENPVIVQGGVQTEVRAACALQAGARPPEATQMAS